MAGGHYVRQNRINEDTGKHYTVLVWVPDAAPKKAPAPKRPKSGEAARLAAQARARALAGRTAAEAARKAAAVARQAHQVALERQRRTAYLTLQKRAAVMRDQALAARGVKPIARKSVLDDAAERAYMDRARRPRPAPAAAKPNPKTVAAIAEARDRWESEDLVRRGVVTDRAAVEKYVADQAKRAGKGATDVSTLDDIAERYAGEATKVADRYTQLVKRINDYIDKGNIKSAKYLYEGAFQKVAKEYTSLFGVPGDPRKEGSVSAFFKNYDAIYKGQSEWTKRQMQAALDSDRLMLQDRIRRLRAVGENEEANKLAQLLAVYNGRTRTVGSPVMRGADGRMGGSRQLTIAEELEQRDAERRIEMERLRAEAVRRSRADKAVLRGHGLTRTIGGGVATYEEDRAMRALSDYVDRKLGGKAPTIKRAEDLTSLIDGAVADWVSRNPAPARVNLRQSNVPGAQQWKDRKDAFERSLYAIYGEKPREWWDRVFQAPGVSHAFATLQGGVAAIGTGGRITLKAATGKSQIDLGVTVGDLPEDIQRQVMATAPASNPGFREMGSGSGLSGGATSDYGARRLAAWLETPAGRSWLKDHTKELLGRLSGEDAAFLKAFYGEGDIGSKLDALNQYGQRPTTHEGANLLFQLLADPTNAIPLKFTTYLARAKYAGELSGKTKFLASTKLGRLRDFVKVDEGTLRGIKSADSLKKEMEALALPDQQIVDRIMSDVVGIKVKEGAAKAIEEKLRAAGVLERAKNPEQLLSLIEEQVGVRLRAQEIPHVSQSDAIKARIAEKQAEQTAEAAARKATQEASAKDAIAKAAERNKAAKGAASRLNTAKVAQRAQIRSEIAELEARGARNVPRPKAEPAKPAPKPKTERQVVQERVERRVETKVTASPKRAELREARHAQEYYDVGPGGELIPGKRKGLGPAEAAGAPGLPRLRRNQQRADAEDVLVNSPFQPTDYDLLERAGVAHDAREAHYLLGDRETLRQLKRDVRRGNRAWVSAFQYKRGEGIRIVDDIERSLGPGEAAVGEDLLAAADSVTGLKHAYEVFSGVETKAAPYSGGVFDIVRNPHWQASLITKKGTVAKKFGRLLRALSEGAAGEGVSGFRDGGQALFELFHGLRRAKKFDELRKLGAFVDTYLDELGDAADADIFAWQWKVMEERAGLPWVPVDAWQAIEEGFMGAALGWNMHPNLALSMIPNGFYARNHPWRFRLSSALLGITDSPIFKAAPASWVESDALKMISKIFQGKYGAKGGATQVTHYTAERFGSFAKGYKIRNRIRDEMVRAIVGSRSLDDLIAAIGDDVPEALRAKVGERGADGKPRALADVLRLELGRPTEYFDRAKRQPKSTQYHVALGEKLQDLYVEGRVSFTSPEGHKLVLLMQLQDDPRTWLGPANLFVDHMEAIGQLDEAKKFLAELFADRRANLHHRYIVERLPGLVKGRDFRYKGQTPAGGSTAALTPEWLLWDRLGFSPNAERAAAWLKNRVELNKTSIFEEMPAASKERQAASNAVAGSERLGVLADEALRSLERLEKYIPDEDIFKAHVANVVLNLEKMIYMVADATDGTRIVGSEYAAVREVIEKLKTMPTRAERTIEHLADRIGESALFERVAQAGRVAEYRAEYLRTVIEVLPEGHKLRVAAEKELLAIETVVGRGAKARRHERTVEAVRKARERKAARAEAGPEKPLEERGRTVEPEVEPYVPPADPKDVARLAYLDELLAQVGGMTDEQWWARIESQARIRVKSKTASAEVKKKAQRILDDIALAKLGRRIERETGSHVSAKDRTRHANRVVATAGKDAEELIAPREVSPFVEDGVAIAVEYSRGLWRWLKAASGEVEPGIDHLGPKFKDLDHFPLQMWEDVNQKVSDAIAEVRKRRADYHTRSRSGRSDSTKAVGRMSDDDPRVIAAKKKILDPLGISVEAYDATRQILQKGLLQKRNGEYLLRQASAGGTFDRELFKRLRAEAARKESKIKLRMLAHEMYGSSPQDVLAEFIARYTDDGTLHEFHPKLTTFQRRTLEEHFKAASGIDDLADDTLISAWLSSRNAPPIHSRAAMKEFLVETGAWSPRTAETFTAGERSWGFAQEAEYMKTNYGLVPEWADEAALTSDRLDPMFDHQDLYYRQHEDWGYFDRSADIAIRQSDKTAEEVAELHIFGDEALGLKAKRELALRRKYAIDRWGKLVSDAQGNLTRMPWLMTEGELRNYMANRIGDALAGDLIQDADELRQVLAIIHKELDHFWEKYIGSKAVDGPIDHADIFRLASKVQERLLDNPVWARRHRDLIGKGLNAWAAGQRAMIFTQVSFLTANVVDVPIKSGWYRYANRGLFSRSLADAPASVAEVARGITARTLGLGDTTLSPRLRGKTARQMMLNPDADTRLRRALERATGLGKAFYRAAPAGAGMAETWGKVRMAQEMYPSALELGKSRGLKGDVAHAWAISFIKDEIGRMWPTVGDHPLAKLWNQVVPFGSYMLLNRTLFISEALAHPSILNQIEFIGRAIEQENLKEWEKKNPGTKMPEWARRRIELPWAPGYYFDLGVLTDATRGLKPLYEAANGPQSYLDFTSQWIRLVNPGTQAGIYMLTNALGITSRIRWRPIRNEDGFVTGYEEVVEGLTEPWSNQQPTWGSVIWILDAVKSYQELGAGGWTNGETSQFLGKLLMFDSVRGVDKGSVLYDVYKEMRLKDREAATRWLNTTEDGRLVKDWLAAHQDSLSEIADLFSLAKHADADPNRWFHTQTAGFQAEVKAARDRITTIRKAFETRLLGLTPGTDEYRQTKAEMYLAISEVYRLTPELVTADVYSKDAAEWSQQLDRWQEDKLLDQFFALDNAKPSRAAYKNKAQYDAAVSAWSHQKEVMLATYPQLRQTVGTARTEFHRVRDQMEKDWTAVLDRTAARSEAIKAAKKAGDDEKADLLYLQQELDYSLLEREYVAMYFTDDDYIEIRDGDAYRLRDGAIKMAKVLLDFDQVRYQKAKREGRGPKFLADLDYAKGMKSAILAAKGGEQFGKFDPKRFVDYVKSHPDFAREYFAKHEGKQEAWRKTDAYVAAIGTWGKAARAGNWDLAEKLWNGLPQWVKDRYYAKHPDRRQKAIQSAAYRGWLGRWVAHFERNDVKGGMAFFWKMPSWVREKYFAKHPDKRGKWESQLKYGAQLAKYFGMDRAYQADYLKANPGLAKFLAANMGSAEFKRNSIIAGYRAIPKDEAWLKRVYREKYPEVFSKEAAGERKLKKVYNQLAAHPEMTPEFEKWVEAIWATYAEMLKHPRVHPEPWTNDRPNASLRRKRARSKSAAEVSR